MQEMTMDEVEEVSAGSFLAYVQVFILGWY